MRKIPLPAALNGSTEERIIRIDSALFFIITGALSALIDLQDYEPTGTLTAEQAKDALASMLEGYLDEEE